MHGILRKWRLVVVVVFLLGGCGGGGGGSAGGSGSAGAGDGTTTGSDGTPRYTVSGVVTVPDTAAVDNDTPASTSWISNDTVGTAQSLSAPVDLIGYLNTPGQGVAGPSQASGDVRDVYRVRLVAGQVIELSYATNTPESDDIDLLLFNADAPTSAPAVGSSGAASGNRECITVTSTGNYFVVPWVTKGAARYSLHIGPVGDGTSCSNASSTIAMFVPGQLVAKPKTILASGKRQDSTGRPLFVMPSLLHVKAPVLQGGKYADPRELDVAQTIETLRQSRRLQASGKYAYVEPNYRTVRASGFAPNDANYSQQLWNHQAIKLPAAMDRLAELGITGTRPVIAIIDNGVMSSNPDLAPQIFSPYSFAGNVAYEGADDTRSRNVCFGAGGGGGLDACGHGTFVAGIAGAVANNGMFGIGVAPMAYLMPLREDDSSFAQSQAILFAAGLPNVSGALPARRADVINMSWGIGGTCPAQFADVIAQARAKNVVVVAAAGNTFGRPAPPSVASPSNCPGVISVGATDTRNQRTAYSGYGSDLTLVAPGGDLQNPIYGTGSQFQTGSNGGITANISSWEHNYGTSFSAPQVAGVIGLMRYVAPSISVMQIDSLLAAGKLTDDLGEAGRDDNYGYGMINALKAVNEAYKFSITGSVPGAVVASPSSIRLGSTLSNAPLKLSLTSSGSEIVTAVTSSSPAIQITRSTDVIAATGLGTYSLTLNRSALPVGVTNARITVTTNERTFTVPVSSIKLSASGNPAASYDRIVVIATNLATSTSYFVTVTPVGGRYAWSLSGMRGGNYRLRASTNLDASINLCVAGEACGDYPGNGQLLVINSVMRDLDFSVAPVLQAPFP